MTQRHSAITGFLYLPGRGAFHGCEVSVALYDDAEPVPVEVQPSLVVVDGVATFVYCGPDAYLPADPRTSDHCPYGMRDGWGHERDAGCWFAWTEAPPYLEILREGRWLRDA